jgi:hypothetical protein
LCCFVNTIKTGETKQMIAKNFTKSKLTLHRFLSHPNGEQLFLVSWNKKKILLGKHFFSQATRKQFAKESK